MEIGLVRRVDIEEKMRSAYLSYAMSVITARALPDVRDGLKPVQRRILYAMHDMGLRHDTPTRKSARIVGEVLGKYHPHGDAAVYDAMVRMAQDFSMRYLLVKGQGNFGSVDGDEAAAMRYTEARLTAIGEELLVDLDKDTVDFGDNFDGSLKEPRVLPAKFPNLLVNGVGGIAVGMATNIPPHNLGEIADAIVFLIDRYARADDVTLDDLVKFVRGPDFPTGGTILGREGIRQAYATGKGRILVRAQAHTENRRGGQSAIIVTELPYQVNKASLVERIAALVREGRIQGIGGLRDESDRTGMRVVIELKRGVESGPVLSQLLKYTQLQTTFGMNMLALVDAEPRVLSLKRILLHHIDHRHEVLVRRTRHQLAKAEARAHILEGLLLALDHLDEVIGTIRRSRTAETARRNLRKKFKLSEVQAQAILDMQLRRLAALERRRIEEEYREIRTRIKYLKSLLASKKKILAIIKQDVLDLKKAYGDVRRSRISDIVDSAECRLEDLMTDEDVLVLVTRKGTVRRLPITTRVRRGGIVGLSSRERDVPQALFKANSQEKIFFFTDRGRVFSLPAHQLPDAQQQERGSLLSSLVRLGDNEQVIAVVHMGDGKEDEFVSMGTVQGKVKRLTLNELAPVGETLVDVIGLAKGDALGWVVNTHGDSELVMVTAQGKAIRFQENSVRAQGRSATGVRGITLKDDDTVISMDVVRGGGELMLVTALGYAKRTPLREYSAQGRGGQGALTVDTSKMAAAGPIAAATVVLPGERVVFGCEKGDRLSVTVEDVPRLRRASWGRLVTRTRRNAVIEVEDGDAVNSLVRLELDAQGPGDKPAAEAEARPSRRSPAKTTATKRKASATGATTPALPALRRQRRRSTSKRTPPKAKDAPESETSKAQPAAKPQETKPKGQTSTSRTQRGQRTPPKRRTAVRRTPRRTRSKKSE